MRFTRTLALAATAAAALSFGAVVPAAGAAPVADDSDIPSYQEFAASTYRDVDGAYIVNGDEVVANQGELKEFYDLLVGPQTPTDGLIVNTVGGVDDKWSTSQVGNLTYCVSTKFGARHADVVSAMASGAALWASIMHYPQCNGTSDDLSMTSEDRAGVVAPYGS
jgi:hypothetical protein